MEFPLVYVVVLNWNSRDDAIECVGSLMNLDYPKYELLVVDNDSSDGSVESLKASFPDLEIIINKTNLGACEGRNVGIRYALEKGADYVALLDNDTVVDQNLLTELVKAGEADPQAGMLVPKVYDYWDKQKIHSAGSRACRFPPGRIKIIGLGKQDSAIYGQQRKIDYATGCALLVKKEVFRQIGLFDPAFFYGLEEYDFSKRVREGGYEIIYVPDGHVWHKVASVREYPVLKWRHLGRATVYFYRKHISKPYFGLPIYVLWIVTRETMLGNLNAVTPFLMGVWDGLSKRVLYVPGGPVPIETTGGD